MKLGNNAQYVIGHKSCTLFPGQGPFVVTRGTLFPGQGQFVVTRGQIVKVVQIQLGFPLSRITIHPTPTHLANLPFPTVGKMGSFISI